jgi:hypothetical protein
MITKLIGEGTPITHRAVNTDFATASVGQDVGIGQEPEESGDRIWVLDAVQYSFRPLDGATTQAKPIRSELTVMVGDKVKWNADIPDPTGVLNFHIPSQTDKVISVLLKGTDGYIGKLNAQWHLEPV